MLPLHFSQQRYHPRELSNATGLESVQTNPEEQSKESDNTSTTNNGDSVIKEDTAILVDEEPTKDDPVENSIADTPFEKFIAGKLVKSSWGPY